MIMSLKDDTADVHQRSEVPDEVLTYWDISKEFVLLFRGKFWEVVVAQRGAEPLKVSTGVEERVMSAPSEYHIRLAEDRPLRSSQDESIAFEGARFGSIALIWMRSSSEKITLVL